MDEKQENDKHKSIQELREQLKQAINGLKVFEDIGDANFECGNKMLLNFFHLLCPKCIDDINNILNSKPINKEKLEKIIKNSIYNELECFLNEEAEIINTTNTEIKIKTAQNNKEKVNGLSFHTYLNYINREIDNYCMTTYCDNDIELHIGELGNIMIKCNEKSLQYNGIYNTLSQLDWECCKFNEILSFPDIEVYISALKDNFKGVTNKKNLTKDIIIKAVKYAQEAVEKMRNKEQVGPKKDDNENILLNNHGDNSCDFCNLNCVKSCKGLCG